MGNGIDPKLVESNCNALVRPDPKVVSALKDKGIGDIGYRVKYDRKTGAPVLYLWQAFTYVRVTMDQMPELMARCAALLHQHQTAPRPPKPKRKSRKRRRRK